MNADERTWSAKVYVDGKERPDIPVFLNEKGKIEFSFPKSDNYRFVSVYCTLDGHDCSFLCMAKPVLLDEHS